MLGVSSNYDLIYNTMIEAVWKLIVGNNDPKREDGCLYIQEFQNEIYGPYRVLTFVYHNEPIATLTEVLGPIEYGFVFRSNRYSEDDFNMAAKEVINSCYGINILSG